MIEMESLKWGPDGLLPVVTQDLATGTVLMQAWVNREALAKTIESGYATYWSRSRQSLWVKGETSGHLQPIRAIRTDCDGDSLLYVVEQQGVACHEGTFSCFTKAIAGAPSQSGAPEAAPTSTNPLIGEVLAQVEAVLRERKVTADPGSYTAKLFAKGPDAYCKKIGEEATEVVLAVKNGDRENLALEVADVWFHTLVALVDNGLGTDAVAEQLKSRQGKRREQK
jgi:phosphoribosyl-ATP pyrophosphohydrolase/phosphoribosyl-AMP cyclohydrolase